MYDTLSGLCSSASAEAQEAVEVFGQQFALCLASVQSDNANPLTAHSLSSVL